MYRKLNHSTKGAAFKLTLLLMAIMGLALGGCSENLPTQADEGTSDPVTGVFRVDGIDDKVDFEFMSVQNEEPGVASEGPFAIRGRNIRYDNEHGFLIVDLSVVNMGDNSYDEGVTLTFLSLLPAGVMVHNSDNAENGNGAAIDFEFANDDAQWTPGEESFLRETHFVVAEGTSIGFVARLDTGTGQEMMGSIGGMVWNDTNGDGIMDEDESGREGAKLVLSAEGMEPVTTLSSADGTYRFDDLASGFYTVMKMPAEGSASTTSPRMFVILATEGGIVSSFMAANFGCMASDDDTPTGVIRGIAWNDLNGDGELDAGELGIAGLTVDLSGDMIATTMTDEDGFFSFMEMARGIYSVQVTGLEGWVATTANRVEVILESDDAVYNESRFGWMEEVVEDPTGIIKGIVWNDLDGNGMQNDEEPGLEGVALELAGDASGSTTSGTDGTFIFSELAAGDYSVASTGLLGWEATTATSVAVTLESDEAMFDQANFGWMEEVTEETGGIIKGIVWNDLDGNGLKNDGEPGLEGAALLLTGATFATATSGADGVFTFSELTAGDYSVASTGPLGWDATTAIMVNVTLESDDAMNDETDFGWKSN